MWVSLSVVNMYRIVAIVLLSIISCDFGVLAANTANETECTESDPLRSKRTLLRNCFKNVVDNHLLKTETGTCRNFSEFRASMANYYSMQDSMCETNFTINNDTFFDLIEFSLENNIFKVFYDDIECVRSKEQELNKCVSDNVGLNITSETKHLSWPQKIELIYDHRSCDIARDVQACTEKVLKSCKPTTEKYVSSLFAFSQKYCKDEQTSNNTAVANKDQGSSSTGLPVAVIIVITVVVLLIAGAIIYLIIRYFISHRKKNQEQYELNQMQ